MKALGIDPSLIRNPIGITVFDLSQEKILKALDVPAKKAWQDTLATMVAQIEALKLEFGPIFLAYEKPHVRHKEYSLQLAHMGGAIIALGVLWGLPVYGASTSEVKTALSGDSKAKKSAQTRAAKIQFGWDLSEHQADGLGALLHAHGLYKIDLWQAQEGK